MSSQPTLSGIDSARSTCSVGSSKIWNRHAGLVVVVHSRTVDWESHVLDVLGYCGPCHNACAMLPMSSLYLVKMVVVAEEEEGGRWISWLLVRVDHTYILTDFFLGNNIIVVDEV